MPSQGDREEGVLQGAHAEAITSTLARGQAEKRQHTSCRAVCGTWVLELDGPISNQLYCSLDVGPGASCYSEQVFPHYKS